MFDKLGKKALAAPFAMGLALCCILALAIGPILRAEPHGVQFGLVNLDKGAVTVAGKVNVGETMKDNLLSGEASLGSSDDEDDADGSSSVDLSSAIAWTQFDNEEDVKAALDANELYGAIIIPSNFTSQQMSSAVGLSSAPKLSIYLNKAKNPQLASTMQTTLSQAMLQAGVGTDVKVVNDADLGGGSMSSTMAVQMMVMPLIIMTMIGSILLSLLVWKKDITGLRATSPALAALLQCALVIVLSAFVAALALSIDVLAGGMSLPFAKLFLFLWLADACIMLCFVGLLDFCFPLGAIVAVGVFALGMSTAMMPAEMLPIFWADWVCPWAPQAYIGQGVRSIIYQAQMPAMTGIVHLIVFGVVGIVALVLALLFSSRKVKEARS